MRRWFSAGISDDVKSSHAEAPDPDRARCVRTLFAFARVDLPADQCRYHQADQDRPGDAAGYRAGRRCTRTQLQLNLKQVSAGRFDRRQRPKLLRYCGAGSFTGRAPRTSDAHGSPVSDILAVKKLTTAADVSVQQRAFEAPGGSNELERDARRQREAWP